MLTISQLSFANDSRIKWICRWTSDSECRDKTPGNYDGFGQCYVRDIFADEPECGYTNSSSSEEMTNKDKNFCRSSSDSACMGLKPGNYSFGSCTVRNIIFREPECAHTKLTSLEGKSNQEKNICRWTSDFKCRDLMPGNYAFGSCVVRRITFGEPECAVK